MDDQGGERSGGRASVLATDGGAIVVASGAAPPSGDQKMKGRKKVGGLPGASSSGGGVEQKPGNKDLPRCRVCDKVFKSCHALYGHMNAHSKKNKARSVLCLPAPPGGNGELVPQEVQLGPALPRPDGLIIDLNEPPPQEEEEDGDHKNEGDNGAAK